MRSRTVLPIRVSPRDGRAHVMLSLTPEEAVVVQRAAEGAAVATWCRWAILRVARAADVAKEAAEGG